MNALSEGMALGEASGLSSTDLLEVLDNGAMSNPMFRLKGYPVCVCVCVCVCVGIYMYM
jgi:3-hydroxyisobutyrate dehydrogenase-like beta-hydroxyacid dehydrogenase